MRKFTLIELLVVIVIVAILLTLLLPSLKGARARGKQAYCASNLKQIFIGMTQYRSQNDNRLWQGGSSGGPGADSWPNLLFPYMGFEDFSQTQLLKERSPSTYCPETDEDRLSSTGPTTYGMESRETWGVKSSNPPRPSMLYIETPAEYIIFADSHRNRIRPDIQDRKLFRIMDRHYKFSANVLTWDGAMHILYPQAIIHAKNVNATTGIRLAYGENPENKY